MTVCFFSSDLHGHKDRYQKLFQAITDERPDAVFLGGDILPSASLMFSSQGFEPLDFITDYLVKSLRKLRKELKEEFPENLLSLGMMMAALQRP